jgi:predicted transcriptional regulator
MADTTTITIRISQETKAALDRLAELTHRSRSFLTSEALNQYLHDEVEIAEGIVQGLADAEAGRVVPHEQVMDEIDAMIAAARKKQARKSA